MIVNIFKQILIFLSYLSTIFTIFFVWWGGAIFGTMSIFTISFLFIFLILFVLVFLISKLVEKFFKKDCAKNKTQKIFSKKFKKIILIVSIMLSPFLIFFTHKFVYKKPPFLIDFIVNNKESKVVDYLNKNVSNDINMQNYLIKQGFDCEFENSKMRCVFEDFFYRDYRKIVILKDKEKIKILQ